MLHLHQNIHIHLHKSLNYLWEMKLTLTFAKVLVKNYVNIDVTNKCLKTPLHHAAMRGNISAITFLVQIGANITVLDISKNQPIVYSIQNGFIGCAKFFSSQWIYQSHVSFNGIGFEKMMKTHTRNWNWASQVINKK